jgi:hypothetical protein
MDDRSCSTRCIIIGIIACLLLAAAPAVIAADGTNTTSPGGTIIVLTFPEGAEVSLNGEYRGITPVRFDDLTPGRYVVGISRAGSRNETIVRTLTPGSRHEIGVTLEPFSSAPAPDGNGSVAVDSSPGGASVMLDGKPAGTTPAGRAALILSDVPAGSHTITVELAGYTPSGSTVTVIKNQVVQVSADFVTRSPTIPGTTIRTTDRREPVPDSIPLFTAAAAAGIAGLAAVFRRS